MEATVEDITNQIPEDDEEDIDDETLLERVMALSEMFPDSLRSGAHTLYKQSVKGLNNAYSFTRSSLWIFGTSVVILALPVVFEVERVQTEEAQLMQQRQILLGPGASGGVPGAAPPMGMPRR
eukprot:gene9048-10017_t